MDTHPSLPGILLINLGTPDAPDPASVRTYLRQFLSDPRVMDLPAPLRWLLLNLIILPFRPARSAHAYRQIFTPQGSPLLVHGRALTSALQTRLEGRAVVALAMRYGRPSLQEGLRSLAREDVDRVIVLPLYPQYSSATTGSTLEALYRLAGSLPNVPPLQAIPPFYRHRGFIEASCRLIQPVIDATAPDKVLFSFHGLPERQLRAADAFAASYRQPSPQASQSGAPADLPPHCLSEDNCCGQLTRQNRHCYRAQCYETARALASALRLSAAQYQVCFQSRMGRIPWIGPHTEETLQRLAQEGCKRLVVVCPAFVADCLETLEEIGLRARETFLKAGGESFALVPCLNASEAWIDALADLLEPYLPARQPPPAALPDAPLVI